MPTNDPIQNLQPRRSQLAAWIGVVLLFAAFGLFVLVVIGAAPRGDTYEEKRGKARAEKFKTANDEANTALNTYGWVDKAKGVARVPISRAMELAAADLAQKKPVAAGPIATPVPPGLQATAPTTQSPAAASPQPAASASPKATSISGPNSESRGQPAGAANPPSAPPGTQPGPGTTPAASPPSAAAQFQPGKGPPSPTSAQSPPGSPLPVRGKTP